MKCRKPLSPTLSYCSINESAKNDTLDVKHGVLPSDDNKRIVYDNPAMKLELVRFYGLMGSACDETHLSTAEGSE